MSIFDNAFDASRPLKTGCSCGLHASEAEHARATQLQRTPVDVQSEEKRYEGVVASAVMRALFPKDAGRRQFLQVLGASSALAAVSHFFPLKTATEVFAATGPLEKKE